MADNSHGNSGIPETVTFVVGLLIVLGTLWWIQGRPSLGEGGLFLNPVAPMDSAQYGTPTDSGEQVPLDPNLRY